LRRRRSEAHASPDCYSLNDGGVAHKQRRRFILSSVSGQASLPIAAITMAEPEWLMLRSRRFRRHCFLCARATVVEVTANYAQD